MTTTQTLLGREIRLRARPLGEPGPEHFALVEAEVPPLGDGQLLVRNRWMSVDPYMRGRMDAGESYIPAFEVGGALEGAALGVVVASRADAIEVGTTVAHFLGWREYAVVDAAAAAVVDLGRATPQAYLGVLGSTGLTAYVALTETAPVREGDVVFVSAAAGAVGSAAGQIARKLGAARVIGSAGGPEKAALLRERFGFDAAIDYKAGSIADALAAAAPDGIDVYLDNVGGETLAAALAAMRTGGRVAIVGHVSQYNLPEPPPGPNLYQLALRELSVRGLLITSRLDRLPAWIERGAAWLDDGSLRSADTVVDGLERAPEALGAVLRGGNVGKMLVRLA